MKLNIKLLTISLVLFVFSVILSSCSEDTPTGPSKEENADNIKDYIAKLSYSSEEMLNYQQTNGSSPERDIISDSSETIQNGNFITICKNTEYDLKKNFEEVAILRPTNGVIWPGALVKGNQSLMDGVPEEINIERAPVTISVDLPGIGEQGVRTVINPTISSVDLAIDSSLQWWNNNAFKEGYVNKANSSYSVSSSYSNKQLALDLNLNVEWAAGSVSSQFNYSTTEEKKVVMMVYKQAFYDVRFDKPVSPESVFSDQVSLSDVKSVINNSDAPAYIKSVTYGRIIMFRMETINTYTSANVEGALDYAGGASVKADLKATYDEILETSSINLVIIGGNAEVATEAISSPGEDAATILQKVQGVIKGKNAVYSKDNPATPIGYTVFYLKDNSLAKLGYTTKYTAKECITSKVSNSIKVYLDELKIIEDCGINGNGEFKYKVEILDENDNNLVSSNESVWKVKKDGEIFDINKTQSFTKKRESGAKFTVRVTCWEKDYDLFGNEKFDSRMNGRTNSQTFSYNNDGGWSGIHDYDTITYYYSLYVGENNCKVQLKFSVEVD